MIAKLVRQRDGLTRGGDIQYIEWDENDRGIDLHEEAQIGFSCIIDPYTMNPTWLTSVITEVISETEFKTKNSHYKIVK